MACIIVGCYSCRYLLKLSDSDYLTCRKGFNTTTWMLNHRQNNTVEIVGTEGCHIHLLGFLCTFQCDPKFGHVKQKQLGSVH